MQIHKKSNWTYQNPHFYANEGNSKSKRHDPNLGGEDMVDSKQRGSKNQTRYRGIQYRDCKLREAVAQMVIPNPSNQKRLVKCILRVDKKFRTYVSDDLRREYH